MQNKQTWVERERTPAKLWFNTELEISTLAVLLIPIIAPPSLYSGSQLRGAEHKRLPPTHRDIVLKQIVVERAIRAGEQADCTATITGQVVAKDGSGRVENHISAHLNRYSSEDNESEVGSLRNEGGRGAQFTHRRHTAQSCG